MEDDFFFGPLCDTYVLCLFMLHPPGGCCLCGKNTEFQKHALAPPGSSGQQQAERSGIGADGGGKQHVLKLYIC